MRCLSLTIAIAWTLTTVPFVSAQEKEKLEDKERQEAIQRHIRNLKSNFSADRIRAAKELAKFGEDAQKAAPALCEAVVESNRKVAVEALEALQQIWPKMHKNVVTILADKDARKRAEAVKDIVLTEGGEAAVPVLIDNIKRFITADDFFGADESVAFSIDAVKRMAPKSASFANVLLAGASPLNKRPNNRMLALTALGEISEEHPKSITQIKRTLNYGLGDQNPKVRIAALKGFANLGKYGNDKATLNAVKRLKLDSDSDVRDAATATLEKLQDN